MFSKGASEPASLKMLIAICTAHPGIRRIINTIDRRSNHVGVSNAPRFPRGCLVTLFGTGHA
jgi:hypothetical protein